MAHTLLGNGVGEGPGDVLLADEILEGLRAIPPSNYDILPWFSGFAGGHFGEGHVR